MKQFMDICAAMLRIVGMMRHKKSRRDHMPNWCNNSIAFYQDDGGNAMISAFYSDIQNYQDCKESETRKSLAWVGHWLQSNGINTDALYSRGFFVGCELYTDHVRIDMETAWVPLQEVWDLMAEKYGLFYVYIAEEPSCEIYVNTDIEGRFFATRYAVNFCDIDDLGLNVEMMSMFEERLQKIGSGMMYFDSFKALAVEFEKLSFSVADVVSLNKQLAIFNIKVYEYSNERSKPGKS